MDRTYDYDIYESIFYNLHTEQLKLLDKSRFFKNISKNCQMTPIQFCYTYQQADGLDVILSKLSKEEKLSCSKELFNNVLHTYKNDKEQIPIIKVLCKHECKIEPKLFNDVIRIGAISELLELTKRLFGRKTVSHILIENMKNILEK